MDPQMKQPNLPNLYEQSGAAAEQWASDESERLANMDAFFAKVAQEDLLPIFDDVKRQSLAQHPKLLDIGAGTGTVTETLCGDKVDYYALDVNNELLAARSTADDHKIVGSAETTGLAEGSFDVTFSRAVTAWNADPRAAIAEQLRVTRPGGYAVFTEFDWTHAGAVTEAELTATAMATKAMMMRVLTTVGFKPEYGARLGRDVDEIVAASGLACEQYEVRHELPPGDHRAILLEGAETILAQLQQFKTGQVAAMARMLEINIKHIREAEEFSFQLPALVTKVVHLAQKAQKN